MNHKAWTSCYRVERTFPSIYSSAQIAVLVLLDSMQEKVEGSLESDLFFYYNFLSFPFL